MNGIFKVESVKEFRLVWNHKKNGWSTIQRYVKTGWFKRVFFGKKYEWVDFGSSNKSEKQLEFFNEYYKDTTIEI